MSNTAPAYTIGNITRPELFFDANGNILLEGAAVDFAAIYGLKLLYLGLPANTPWPPVTPPPLSAPIDTLSTPASVAEGAAANTAVNLTVQATSSSGNAVTYSLTADSSGGGFKIDPHTGVVTVADPTKVDYEAPGHAFSVTVQASDGISASSQAFSIAVTDVAPSAPTDANPGANTVAEGAAVNTLVGITAASTVSITDPAATYSLVGDTSGGGFKIDPHTGVVSVADPSKIDYENSGPGHSYTITVQASDGALTNVSSFTVAVTDPALQAPTDTNGAANSVAEGAAVNTLVGLTASAATPVNDPAATYSLTADSSGGGFKIDPNTGVVSVADPTKIDYETAPGHAYSITVQATDGSSTTSQVFSIAVTDPAPSTPADTDATTNTVVEGAAAGTAVGITASSTVATNDPAATYSLIGDTSGGGFQIDPVTGVVTVADATKIDYENSGPGHSFNITVQASDGVTTSSQVFAIAVTDVPPSAPVDTNATANSVAEGAAAGTLVGITASSTSGANDPAATYSLTADSSNGGFKIDPVTGVVSVADPTKVDYETAPGHAYSITVQSSDGALTNSSVFTIAVTDPPLPTPVDNNASANSVAEGATAGTAVGLTAFAAAAANDPAATYSLTADSSNGGFTIDPNTGVVTVADPTKIDYETAPGHSYTVTVQATDGTSTTSANFAIAVTDPAPSTPADSDATANTVVEGAAANTLVGITASSTSATTDPAATYSLTGDTSGGGFQINSTTGVVSVNDPTKIDYDTAPGHAYSITVQANDGTQTSSQVFTIGVTDVAPTAPVDSDGTTNSVAEGAAANTLVGITAASTTSTNDPPATYSLVVDTSGGGFKIDPNTGVVSVADPTKIDYESAPAHAYSITVQASDGVLTSSQVFTIAVTDPPLPSPVDNNASANSVAEGAAAGTSVGLTAFASTPVTDPSATYSLTGDTSGGGFQINSTTGVVTVADPTKLDYETAVGHDYTVTVQASDGVSTASSNFTIAITDPPPSAPVDTNAGTNTVAEAATANTLVGITASSTDATNDAAPTYSLTGDTSGGGFQINSTTGVVSVADPTKIDYESSGAGHSYTITVQSSDGVATNSSNFTIAVTDVAAVANADSAVVYESRTTTPTIDLRANDTDVDAASSSLTAVKDTNPAHGTVTINADGTFNYTANAGYLGADSFTYHDTNGGTLSSNSATVTLDVQPLVWHIDNTAAAGGDGSAAHPFNSIAAFNTANAAAGNHPDVVYVHAGTYNEANGVHLDNGQQLVGQGAAVTYQTSASSPGGVQTITLIAADANPAHVPTINATAGDAVDLAQNNTVTSIHIGNASGSGISDEGGTVGTLNISNVDINTSGQAVHIVNGGTLNVDLSSVTSTGGTNGIALTNTGGTFHVEGGSLTGASGAEVSISGGSVTFTDNGTVGNTSGSNVAISSTTGGTDSFTGAITGHGISLTNNAGTMDFSGGLNLSTGASNAFSATGGGTVNVTGTNHLTTTTGTALNVANTTIGTSGITFHDISANGGANGIVLNNTGASGGLTVTGSGNTLPGGDSSGGTIQSTTGDGIVLTSTSNVSLADMYVHNTAGDGINGTTVSGFTLSGSTFTTDGTSVSGIGQGDVYFTGLSGSASVTNSTFTGAAYDAFHVFNDLGQILNRITMTGDTFATQGGAGNLSNSAVVFEATGGTFNATIQGSTFNSARNDLFHFNLLGTVSANLVFGGGTALLGNTLHNTNQNIVSGAAGIDVGGGGPTNNITLTYNISHNSISGVAGADIAVFKGTGTNASFIGTIDSNTIGTVGVDHSGSTQGEGIAVFQDGAGSSSTTITNNHISGVVAGAGAIDLLNHNGGGGTMTAVVQGNTIDTLDQTSSFSGIYLQTGSSGSTDNNKSDYTIGGPGLLANNVDIGSNTAGNIAAGIILDQEGNTIVGLIGSPNYSGSPTDTNAVQNYVAGNNTVTSNGSPTLGGGAIPVFALASGNGGSGYFGGAQFLLAAPGGVEASSPTTGETHLTQSELDSVVAAAIADWAAAGASASQLAALHATTFSVATLSGNIIGEETTPAHITIDASAAGQGWFVDPTPTNNSEFTHALNAAGTDLLTDPSNAAAGHLDLLTAVTHEMGHVLGLPDITSTSAATDLMYIGLADGERKLPAAADVAQASIGTAVDGVTMPTSGPTSGPTPTNTPLVADAGGHDGSGSGTPTPTPTPPTPPVTASPVVRGAALGGWDGDGKGDVGQHGGATVADNFVFANNPEPNTAPSPLKSVVNLGGDGFDFSALGQTVHLPGSDAPPVQAAGDTLVNLKSNPTFDTLFSTVAGTDLHPTAADSSKSGAPPLGGSPIDHVEIGGFAAIHPGQIHVDLLV